MRNRFDRELERLNNELINMGAMIERSIDVAVTALISKDSASARCAIEYDNEIDEKEKEIERLCLKLLLQQQPVATDLRLISTALKMIADMERIGDQAADISEITLFIGEYDVAFESIPFPEMAEATKKMVKECIDAFVNRDIELAKKVIDYDDVVDNLFNKIRGDLIELVSNCSRHGEQLVDFLMIAKYFERIGDHAVNIAEWVIFSLTGQHKNQRIL